jgi:hypothetical protein
LFKSQSKPKYRKLVSLADLALRCQRPASYSEFSIANALRRCGAVCRAVRIPQHRMPALTTDVLAAWASLRGSDGTRPLNATDPGRLRHG